MAKDYYNILDIQKNASKDEIKKAFHKLAHKYHPDKSGGDDKKFKEINEAYQILSDDKKRREYDTYGSTFENAQQQGQGFGGFSSQGGPSSGWDFSGFQNQNGGIDFDFGNINDIFGDFFGGGTGRQQERRGRDISTEMHISFSEAVFGVERKVVIPKTSYCDICEGSGAKPGTNTKTCETCNGQGKIHETKRSFLGSFTSVRACNTCLGSGKVPSEKCITCKGAGVLKKNEEITIKIPYGINNGEMIRMTGAGEAIAHGIAGDLYIKINVSAHQLFKRDGINLTMDMDIKLTDALLGTEYTIKTLDGAVKISIPEGVSPEETLRVREKGIPIGKNKRGDLLIKVHIKLPKKLSKKSRELVDKLKEDGV